MQIDLTDRNVVITGSTGRLGQRMLAAFQHTNATVITIDRNIQSELIDTFDVDFATQADVTDESSVSGCFEHILQEMGPPDTVIHTVGGWDGRPLLETTLDQWNQMMDLNLTSAFLVFRESLRHMENRQGALIGIAAGQGADRGVAEQAAYSATKGGLIRLIESIAEEYQGTGITAHAIAPSTILYDDASDGEGVPAMHLADLCVYLATDAGRSLSGATLRAYGR